MDIAPSTISSIIQGVRDRTGDLDDLRRLNMGLREARARLPDALRGAILLSRLNDLFLGSKYPPDAKYVRFIPPCQVYGKKNSNEFHPLQEAAYPSYSPAY